MARFIQISMASVALMFAVGAAQIIAKEKASEQVAPETCDCEVQSGMCEYWFETEPGFCKYDETPCDKCVCVAGGQMTCEIASGTALAVTNPQNGACEVIKTTYAVCPADTPRPTATPTPAPAAGGWYLAAASESCDAKCASVGSTCNANQIQDLNNVAVGSTATYGAFMLSEFGYSCPGFEDCGFNCVGNAQPGIEIGSGPCEYSSQQTFTSCSDANGKLERVCCCGSAADCPI
mmetsp:Transcript_14794/g.31726  ORF Transcript_14794/g.31726 Transcript_14794/m.31726 type:complete len:235 (+) Transcript_14794:90-794(+)